MYKAITIKVKYRELIVHLLGVKCDYGIGIICVIVKIGPVEEQPLRLFATIKSNRCVQFSLPIVGMTLKDRLADYLMI